MISEVISIITSKQKAKYVNKKILLIIVLNIGYWLTSGFLVGSVNPWDILNYDFLSGSGRIFITHIPIIFFCIYSSSVKNHIKEILFSVEIIKILSIVSILLMFVWLPTHMEFLQKTNSFISLMTGHTSAAGYFGYLASFLIIYSSGAKKKDLLLIGVLTLLPLIASGGRGALLSTLFTLAIYFGKNLSIKRIIQVAAITIVAVVVIGGVFLAVGKGNFYGLDRLSSITDPDVWAKAKDILANSNWQPGYLRNLGEDSADSNVLTRIMYWAYSTQRFLESPIVGIGWDRFSDLNNQYYGIKGLLYLAIKGEKIFDDPGAAHNAYLTFLCESGIIGLCLNLWFWIEMVRTLNRAQKYCENNSTLTSFIAASRCQIYYILAQSMTGHVLAAPTAGVPVFILTGLGISLARHQSEAKPVETSLKSISSKTSLESTA
ncbi:MAG TPA: O-antigen ligase family protein [Stenomitos sp.]